MCLYAYVLIRYYFLMGLPFSEQNPKEVHVDNGSFHHQGIPKTNHISIFPQHPKSICRSGTQMFMVKFFIGNFYFDVNKSENPTTIEDLYSQYLFEVLFCSYLHAFYQRLLVTQLHPTDPWYPLFHLHLSCHSIRIASQPSSRLLDHEKTYTCHLFHTSLV